MYMDFYYEKVIILPFYYLLHILQKLEQPLISPTPECAHELHYLPCLPAKERRLPSALQYTRPHRQMFIVTGASIMSSLQWGSQFPKISHHLTREELPFLLCLGQGWQGRLGMKHHHHIFRHSCSRPNGIWREIVLNPCLEKNHYS